MSESNQTSNNDISMRQDPNSTDTTDLPPNVIALNIKSLEQQTKPVRVSRDASVLDLKQAVQTAFQVESGRQRLIFQGRVLKDEKTLADYANLDNGKVVHLVVRPADAPQNPNNDEPRAQNDNRRPFGRSLPFPRMFPTFGGRFPMLEGGYTVITVDVGDPSPLSSLMDGFGAALGVGGVPANSPNRSTASTGEREPPNSNQSNTRAARNSPSTTIPRLPSEAGLGSRSISDLGSLSPEGRAFAGLPFPPSVEVRLMRTMSCIRNVRRILDTPLDQGIMGIATASTSSPEQAQEIRSRLRSNGSSQTAAVGVVLDELSNLMVDVIPRLREVSDALREGDQTVSNEDNVQLYRRVLRTARVIQGMSLINHFLGSVLAAADISFRRSRPRSQSTTGSTTRLSSADDPGSSQADRTEESTASAKSQTKEDRKAKEDTGEGSSDAQATNRGTKRNNTDIDNEEEASSSNLASKKLAKGKGRQNER
ncbi:hypothetical protein VTP01DRAFT_4932 [Rhizomucor pusillus]|uniref:uncharacterized protein n=1 Tax=Rhizomucor pusillus TaxID=4840 RepID=UPI0037434216